MAPLLAAVQPTTHTGERSCGPNCRCGMLPDLPRRSSSCLLISPLSRTLQGMPRASFAELCSHTQCHAVPECMRLGTTSNIETQPEETDPNIRDMSSVGCHCWVHCLWRDASMKRTVIHSCEGTHCIVLDFLGTGAMHAPVSECDRAKNRRCSHQTARQTLQNFTSSASRRLDSCNPCTVNCDLFGQTLMPDAVHGNMLLLYIGSHAACSRWAYISLAGFLL